MWVWAGQIFACARLGPRAVLASGKIVGNMTTGQTDSNIDRQYTANEEIHVTFRDRGKCQKETRRSM